MKYEERDGLRQRVSNEVRNVPRINNAKKIMPYYHRKTHMKSIQ